MVFPHRACASRRRCSHSGISMGLYLVATPRDGWWLSSPSGTAGASPPYRPRLLLEAAVSAALPLGQSQRPVSGADSIRSRNRRVTEPETRSVVDNAPGVQLAAILGLDPYGPVVDGHRVRRYRRGPPATIVKIDERASLKSRPELSSRAMGKLLYLSRADVERLLDVDSMLEALGRALVVFSSGQASVPP